MCGIMGYYAFSSKRPDKEKISTMFSLLETRGHDAAGFAFIREGNLIVNKAPIRSSVLVQSKDWQELELPRIMILHTRMKTQGSEKNPSNNHPIYNKEGVCIVHNGIIHNDHEIFGKNQKRDGEVDSEAILAVISSRGKGDKIKKVFDRIDGSFAVAVIDKNNPEQLILIKKDNPLELYYNSEDDILYFCSERQIMQEALGIQSESKRGFNLGENQFHYYDMENNHGLVLNSEGVDSYKKYNVRDWWSEKASYGRHDIDLLRVQCPHCLSQTKYYDGVLHNKCEVCGAWINEEDLYGSIW
jgi:glucosamine 6-phosphate synthetase-like amidotransferase/phosphosugar isomerase protein